MMNQTANGAGTLDLLFTGSMSANKAERQHGKLPISKAL
jgi:hypothetical protein